MTVNEILKSQSFSPVSQQRNANITDKLNTNGAKFSDTLKEFVGDVNSIQKQSASQTDRFIKGEAVDMHDVMIASEKAKTSFSLLMEMRNKALDMYREVIRIQV